MCLPRIILGQFCPAEVFAKWVSAKVPTSFLPTEIVLDIVEVILDFGPANYFLGKSGLQKRCLGVNGVFFRNAHLFIVLFVRNLGEFVRRFG